MSERCVGTVVDQHGPWQVLCNIWQMLPEYRNCLQIWCKQMNILGMFSLWWIVICKLTIQTDAKMHCTLMINLLMIYRNRAWGASGGPWGTSRFQERQTAHHHMFVFEAFGFTWTRIGPRIKYEVVMESRFKKQVPCKLAEQMLFASSFSQLEV